jgi:uncharacterized protein (TIGR03437 family)
VVNAASFAPGIVAGSLATVFATGLREVSGASAASGVPLPKVIDEVSVTVGGVRAPMVSVSREGLEQVNFQVPFELAGFAAADVAVTRSGKSSAARTITIHVEQPGVYFTGAGNGVAVHNADFSLVTDASPLVQGEYAFVYAAGLGAVTNRPATGSAAPVSPLAEVRAPVRVTLGGQPCQVVFAGLAPGFVGVYQVNFRVPSSIPSGTQTFELGVGGVDAPVVTLPVR